MRGERAGSSGYKYCVDGRGGLIDADCSGRYNDFGLSFAKAEKR